MKNNTKQYIFEYKMGFVNILSFIIIILLGVLLFVLYKFDVLNDILEKLANPTLKTDHSLALFIEIIIIFLWLVLHEIIHGISYVIMGAKSKNITFGMALEKGIFFTKCGEDINKKNILVSVIAPFVLIGIIPLIISIIITSPILLILSLINISGCSGDLMMFTFFLGRNKDCLFKELNDSTTFSLTTSEDLTNKKFLGVKLSEKQELPKEEKKYKQKIYISRPSKWIILITLIILLLLIISAIL